MKYTSLFDLELVSFLQHSNIFLTFESFRRGASLIIFTVKLPKLCYNAVIDDKLQFQSLVCISCFREIGLSKRSHCLDIETAHNTVRNALYKSTEYSNSTLNCLSQLLGELDHVIDETKDNSDKVINA